MGRHIRKKHIGIFSVISLAVLMAWMMLALFKPAQDYRIQTAVPALDSPEFSRVMETISGAKLQNANRIEVLPNGEKFYAAELAAIATAKQSVNVEAYIFKKGEVEDRFQQALADASRRGVKVKMVVDAMGSFSTSKKDFKTLVDAGGWVAFYHPLRWYSWDRVNNRTHRELMIIDGQKGFIGGAGIADHWYKAVDGEARWRDTMVQVEGPAVSAMQGTFAENWVESSGELVVSPEYYPEQASPGNSTAMVVNSSASLGRSTRARMVFQLLMAAAKKSLLITTPYFLPDHVFREELLRAAQRGVAIKIITPGKHSDHTVTRSSSRRLFGDLLQAGIEIYEYKPAMMHQKAMMVDGTWTVVGSTNMDNRSFELNDEVNLVAYDEALASRMKEEFENDLKQSHHLTYEEWKRRPFWERGTEWVGRVIERQQ